LYAALRSSNQPWTRRSQLLLLLRANLLLTHSRLTLETGGKNNVLGVALGDSVYLWNAADGGIQQLLQTTGEQSHVTSLAWGQEGASHLLAVGTSDHKVQLWDAVRRHVGARSGLTIRSDQRACSACASA